MSRVCKSPNVKTETMLTHMWEFCTFHLLFPPISQMEFYRSVFLCWQSTFWDNPQYYRWAKNRKGSIVSLAWTWVSVWQHARVSVSKQILASKPAKYKNLSKHSVTEKCPLCIKEPSAVSWWETTVKVSMRETEWEQERKANGTGKRKQWRERTESREAWTSLY